MATDGDVRFGAGEKLTVPGSVSIDATDTVVLSDVSALAIDVVAPVIEVNARAAGSSLQADGTLLLERVLRESGGK